MIDREVFEKTMRFRKFFKTNDSLKVSLMEDRHYMKYSVIPGDQFPVPIPVMNVLNMIESPQYKVQVFAWLMGEGLRLAAVRRRRLARIISQNIGIEIPQEALFSKKAHEQIPELAEAFEKYDIMSQWMKSFEPKKIDLIPAARQSQEKAPQISLDQINAYLLDQRKTPFHYGGFDGLLEYIENGEWRETPIGDPEITPYGKEGISLSVDTPDGTKVRRSSDGQTFRIISLGEDPNATVQSKREAIDFNELKTRYDIEFDEKGRPFSSSNAIKFVTFLKGSNGPQISIQPKGGGEILYDVEGDGPIENRTFRTPKFAVHSGSYVVPEFGTSASSSASYWSKRLQSAQKQTRQKAMELMQAIKNGENIDDLGGDDLDYLKQLVKNGDLSVSDNEETTMAKLANLITRGGQEGEGGWQKPSGTDEDGGPTDEEWAKYKAAVKAGIIESLKRPATSANDPTNWGIGSQARPKFIVSGSKRRFGTQAHPSHVLDLNDPKWLKADTDSDAELIADKLVSMIFDDETKQMATSVTIRRPKQTSKAKKELTVFMNPVAGKKGHLTGYTALNAMMQGNSVSSDVIKKLISQKGWQPSEKITNSSFNMKRRIELQKDGKTRVFVRPNTENETWTELLDSQNQISVSVGDKKYNFTPKGLLKDMMSMAQSPLTMPGIAVQHTVDAEKNEIDIDQYERNGWVPIGVSAKRPDPDNPGSTKITQLIARNMSEIPDDVTEVDIALNGLKFTTKRLVRNDAESPWQEIKPKKRELKSKDEIQEYLKSGYKDAWYDNNKSILQLFHPETKDEMLFSVQDDGFWQIPKPSDQGDVKNPIAAYLSNKVNPANWGIRRKVTASPEKVAARWDDFISNPEKYGTSINKKNGYPLEVIEAANSGHVTQFLPDEIRGMRVLDEFGSDALNRLKDSLFDLKFRYGSVTDSEDPDREDHLPSNLERFGVTDNKNQENIKRFVIQELFRNKRKAEKITNTESLSDVVKGSDGQILCAIDPSGNAVFAPIVLDAILANGRGWRKTQAMLGIIRDGLRKNVDFRMTARGEGGKDDDETRSEIEDVPRDTRGEEGKDLIDDEFLNTDDEKFVKQIDDQDDDLSSLSGASAEVEIDPTVSNKRKSIETDFRAGPKVLDDETPQDISQVTDDLGKHQVAKGGVRQSPQLEMPKKKSFSFEDIFGEEEPQQPVKPAIPQPAIPQPVKPAQQKPQMFTYEDIFDENFLSFNNWLDLFETGPYDPKVAKKKDRTFNVWGAPPQGKVPQKSIDGEADTVEKDPDGSKGVKNGRQ